MTGLMTGADDYVTKPFSPAELTARVDALYRRTGGDAPADSGEISPAALPAEHPQPHPGEKRRAHQADPGGVQYHQAVSWTTRARPSPGRRFWTRSGGGTTIGEVKIVDVNIRRLRIKIEDDPTSPTYITTVWGYGYKWGF